MDRRSGSEPAGLSLLGRPAVAATLLASLLVCALLVRLPVLYNSAETFNSDEAVNALVIKHILEGREFRLHNWDTNYYGIVEGIVAVPFVALLGFEPLAFKLAAVTCYLVLMVLVYLLGRRVYDRATGLLAAAILVTFSPQVVQWSTLASGGYALVVAWGTLAVLLHARLQESPTLARWLVLGLVLGFGLYIYELFLVYLPPLVAALWLGLRERRTARARQRGGTDGAAGSDAAGGPLRALAALAAGFVAGWSPKLYAVAVGPAAGRTRSYGVADWETVRHNLDLLVHSCLPAFLAGDAAGAPGGAVYVRPAWPGSTVLGGLFMGTFLLAAAWAVLRCRRELLRAVTLRPVVLSTEAVLVLVIVATVAAFVLSRNPHDAFSNRYLLPWLTSLPLLAAAFLRRLQRLAAPVAVGLAVVLLAYPLLPTYQHHVRIGFLAPGLRLAKSPDPVAALISYLDEHQIHRAYSTYWTSYATTMRSDERIVVSPFRDWVRYQPYRDEVDAAPDPVYILPANGQLARSLEERLSREGIAFVAHRVAGNLVFSSPGGGRLLPPE